MSLPISIYNLWAKKKPYPRSKMSEVYKDSVIIDGCSPLCATFNEYKRYLNGGVTAACCTVLKPGSYDLQECIKGFIDYYNKIDKDSATKLILSVDDLYQAKKEGKFGIILSFQGGAYLRGDIRMLEEYYHLGLRQLMLCYNEKNALGDGCTEPGDGGLTLLGVKCINEMTRLGIVTDIAHTGYRTTMEAMEIMQALGKPCIVSHGNAKAVYDTPRNLTDEQALRCAEVGGIVGVNGYPGFISVKKKPSVDDFLDHIDHYVKLLGIDHVSLGMDYYQFQHVIFPNIVNKKVYDYLIEAGTWTKEAYPEPPYYYPQGIQVPDLLPNLVPAMQKRGYSDSNIRQVLGENYIRVLKEIWN